MSLGTVKKHCNCLTYLGFCVFLKNKKAHKVFAHEGCEVYVILCYLLCWYWIRRCVQCYLDFWLSWFNISFAEPQQSRGVHIIPRVVCFQMALFCPIPSAAYFTRKRKTSQCQSEMGLTSYLLDICSSKGSIWHHIFKIYKYKSRCLLNHPGKHDWAIISE